MQAKTKFSVGLGAVFWCSSAWAQFACAPGSLTFGDIDQRGDVAETDVAAFSQCLSGPGKEPDPKAPLTTEKCLETFDGDDDGDVDAIDSARLQRSYTGECEGLGQCPAGTHLEHMTGQVGIVDPDSYDDESGTGEPAPPPGSPPPEEYRCVADETCDGVDCGKNGRCEVMSGKAVCACGAGYAGLACDECATGYEFDRVKGCVLGGDCREVFCSGQGDCVEKDGEISCVCDDGASGDHCQDGGGGPNLRAPTYVEISGTDRSIQQGEQREICATLFGGGQIAQQLTWSIEGPGAFTTLDNCMFYLAPPPGSFVETELVEIRVCSQMFPEQCATRYLTVDPPGGIRSTGQSHAVLKPFDDVMRQYMRMRCVGGAVLGVSVFGKPVFVRGYGNLSGAPTNDPAYLAACGDQFNISGTLGSINLPPPSEVQPSTPFRIGSVSKPVTAAILRKHVKEEITVSDTDANVEALALCDGLLPPVLNEVACQGQPTPLNLQSLSGVGPNCTGSNPCPYGGTCVVTNEETGEGYCDGCPAGRTGLDCSRELSHCPNTEADDRWEDVTLGLVMGHSAGLPRSVPILERVILPGLFQLRGLMEQSDWADQESELESENGWPNGDFDFEFPNYAGADSDLGASRYFVPRPTVQDAVLARMGNCLASEPGAVTSYSNTGFALLGEIVEYITGRHFSGELGRPDLHTGSLLEEFNTEQLGLPIPGQASDGIYHSQDVYDLRNPLEPIYRAWSDDTNSYYKLVTDKKRPWCEWFGGSGICSFNDWVDGLDRYDWRFVNQGTLVGYHGAGYAGPATTGSLAVEAEVFLKFMSKYWVGGDGTNPRYGETRCPNGDCIWNLATGHNGARDGTYAEAKQLGGPVKPASQQNCSDDSDCPLYSACGGTQTRQEFCRGGKCWRYNEYSVPATDASGDITDDFANLECKTCRLPVGVDIFVALNQGTDKKCREAESLDPSDPDYYTCDTAYSRLPLFLLHAACQVQWPPNSFVLWPPVFENGGSTMSPGFAEAP